MTESTIVPSPAPRNSGPIGQHRGIGISILLAIVTLGIYCFVWVWKTQAEIQRRSGQGVGGPIGFIIYFFVSIVTFYLVPYEVRKMIEQDGGTSRVSGVTGWWWLLPIAGPIIWFVKVQGQLNDYWQSVAPAAPAAVAQA